MMNRKASFIATLVLAGVLTGVNLQNAAAQSTASANPSLTFDVASVRAIDYQATGAVHAGPGYADPGRLSYPGVDLIFILTQAFGLQRDEILGVSDLKGVGYGYRVEATMPKETTKEQFQIMLQNLLAERFHLAYHFETKKFPGYELESLPGQSPRREGLPGVTLSPEDKARAFQAPGGPPDAKGFPSLPPGASWRFVSPRMGTVGTIRGRFHVSMDELLTYMPYMILQSLQVPTGSTPLPRVLNHTGLKGVYDFTLEYVGGTLYASSATDPVEGSGGGPTLFTALEKQAGLRLRKIKDVDVKVLVVDHADKIPTDN